MHLSAGWDAAVHDEFKGALNAFYQPFIARLSETLLDKPVEALTVEEHRVILTEARKTLMRSIVPDNSAN
jgi:hypothetical protein